MQSLQFSNISTKRGKITDLTNLNPLKKNENHKDSLNQANVEERNINLNRDNKNDSYNNQNISQNKLNTSSNNKDDIINDLGNKILDLETKLTLIEKNNNSKNIRFSPKNQIPKNLNLKTLTNKELIIRTFSNEKKKQVNENNYFNFSSKLKSIKNKEHKTKDHFFLFNDWKQINFNSIEVNGKSKNRNKIFSNSKEKKKAEIEKYKLNSSTNNNYINKKKVSLNKLINVSQSNKNLNFISIENINESNNSLLKSENSSESNRIINFNQKINLHSKDNMLIVGSSKRNFNKKNRTDISFNNSLLHSANKGKNSAKVNLAESNIYLNHNKGKSSFLNQERKPEFANSINMINEYTNNFSNKENSFFEQEKSVKKSKEKSNKNVIFKPVIPKNSSKKNIINNKISYNSNNFKANNSINNISGNINSNSINISLNTPKNIVNFLGKFNDKDYHPQIVQNSKFNLKFKNDNNNYLINHTSEKNQSISQTNKNFNQLRSLDNKFCKNNFSNISFELKPNELNDKSLTTKKDDNVTEDKINLNSNTELSVSIINQNKKKYFLLEEIQNEENNDFICFKNKKNNDFFKSNSGNINHSNKNLNLNSLNNSSNFDSNKNQRKNLENLGNDSLTNNNIFKNENNKSNGLLSRSQNKKKNTNKNKSFQGNNTNDRNDNTDNIENTNLQTDSGVLFKGNYYDKNIQLTNLSENYSQDKSSNKNLTNTLNQINTYNHVEDRNVYHVSNDIFDNLELLKNRAHLVFEKYNQTCSELRNMLKKKN